jgi:hypothetical protein
MSFYDDASLVVIPSGYKTSKVYAEKPTDGSGDLAFTRTGDTATRVNSAGLIEKVRTNLVLQSETFNTTWTASRGSVTANATTAPNGTTTADKFVADTQVNPHFISQTISGLTNGGIYTSSVYAKASEWNSIAIFRGDSAVGVSFRLDTQATSVIIGTPTTYSILSVGNGWYRCSVSFAIASTSDGAQIRVGNNAAFSIAGDNINGLFLWGAQYEVSDFGATDYIPTTTAAVSVGPVANVPRLDYLGSSCPRLLLEGQRQNEFQYSEQANNAYWSLFGATISANTTATLDPAGYYGADKLQEDTSTGGHTYGVSISGGSTTKTLSVFAKAAERNWAALRLYNGTSSFFAYFNLSTGALGSVTAGATSAITSYGNGWYRCSITLALGAGSCEPNIFASTGNGTTSYLGVTGSGIYVYGAQLEEGAYATSYIPTLASASTRSADACSKTGISSLIGQTEGTLFAEFTTSGLPAVDQYFFSLSDGTTTNIIYLGFYSTILVARIIDAGSLGCNINVGLAENTTYKVAFAYKANDCKLYINGVDSGTDTSATIPAVSQFGMNQINNIAAYKANQALLFKTRLTNAEMATLTTL